MSKDQSSTISISHILNEKGSNKETGLTIGLEKKSAEQGSGKRPFEGENSEHVKAQKVSTLHQTQHYEALSIARLRLHTERGDSGEFLDNFHSTIVKNSRIPLRETSRGTDSGLSCLKSPRCPAQLGAISHYRKLQAPRIIPLPHQQRLPTLGSVPRRSRRRNSCGRHAAKPAAAARAEPGGADPEPARMAAAAPRHTQRAPAPPRPGAFRPPPRAPPPLRRPVRPRGPGITGRHPGGGQAGAGGRAAGRNRQTGPGPGRAARGRAGARPSRRPRRARPAAGGAAASQAGAATAGGGAAPGARAEGGDGGGELRLGWEGPRVCFWCWPPEAPGE